MNKHLRNRMSKAMLAFKQEGKSVAQVADALAQMAEDHYRPPGNDEQTAKVYLLYPRTSGGSTAKSAIARAIKRSDYEVVLEGTKKYKECIDRYGINSKHEKYHLLPNCTTWFNQDRYLLNEAEWSAPFRDGKYTNYSEIAKPTALIEPKNWVEIMNKLYEGNSYNGSWDNLDPDVKQEILNENA